MRGSEALRAGLAGLLAAGVVLLVLGGPVRDEGGDGGGGGTQASAVAAPSDTAAGRALFARMGCGGCHQLAAGGGGTAAAGPNLDTVLPNYNAAMLRAKIVDPYPAGPSESFVQMPEDFGSRMSAKELDQLVAFLLSTARD